MSRSKKAEDLSVEELRRLLVMKRRRFRKNRLDQFGRTGRMVTLVPDADAPTQEDFHTDPFPRDYETPQDSSRPRGRRTFDTILLVVEIVAVVALGFVLFNGLELIRELNQEVAGVLEQPTLTATPLIIAAVLPSGHTPPTSPGGAQPNDAEIPEHLRPLVQSLASIPIPTPGPEQAIRVQIPAIGVDAPIVQGDGWEHLKKGVGQHIGSAVPGQNGNLVLSAHNDVFGEIFRNLDHLKTGDQIIVYTNQRSHTYVVMVSRIVEPTQVEVMAATHDPTMTLISCYPYLVDDQRIVIHAALQES